MIGALNLIKSKQSSFDCKRLSDGAAKTSSRGVIAACVWLTFCGNSFATAEVSSESQLFEEKSADSFTKIDRRIEQMKAIQDVYYQIKQNGGWEPVSRDALLRKGSQGTGVYTVVKRLRAEYPELEKVCAQTASSPSKPESCRYSEDVVAAVKDFQARHGLQVDGIVGSSTTAALNVSAADRYQQISLNIERLREFEPKVQASFVVINIPEYRLRYVKSGRVAFMKDVVVGKPSWKTPSFSDTIEKFVVNPEWRIPLSIATREIAPKAASNPDYFDENNIVIRKDSYVDDELVDPSTIAWDKVEPYEFDHFMVKLPHDENPLGEVKYLFPNRHAVYVHDTPFQQWFEEPQRAASHGCIRLEDPFGLAKTIAKDQEVEKLLDNVHSARLKEEPKTFHLENPLPIHLVYWTAWTDEQGRINFREDIYNRDPADFEKLAAP